MSEFVVRNGLIVSGSTYLEAISQSNEAFILSYDSTTNEVGFMPTSSVVVTVPGSDTQVIFNNGGVFGASSNLVFSGSRVGIGTTSPAVPLQIKDSTISSGGPALNVFGYDGAADLFTTRDESPFNAALYLHNNPLVGQGYGTGILFRAKSDTTNSRIQGAIGTTWTTATDATRTSQMLFRTVNAGVESVKLTIEGTGAATFSSSVTATRTIATAGDMEIQGTANAIKTLYINRYGVATGSQHRLRAENAYFEIASANSEPIVLTGGNVGIGTTAPRGVLDISSGLRTGTTSGLFLGADADTSSGIRTNNTRKIGLIATPHYGNASLPVFGISMDNQVSNNFIHIGGTYSGYNAATEITFSTGATTTTETGTERMRITSGGNVLINTTTDSGFKLDVNGTARVGALTGTSATFSSSVTAGHLTTVSPGGGVNSATFRDRTNVVGVEVNEFGTLIGYSGIISNNGEFGNNSSGTPLIFKAGATEQFRISATNMVVIGSVTATSFIPNGTTVPTIGMYSSAANTLDFSTNSGNKLSIASGGAATFSSSVTAVSALLQSANTNAVVDIFTLYNPSQTSSGVRQKFANGYGDLASIRVSQIDNGAGADNGKIEFQTSTDTILSTKLTILDSGAATFSSSVTATSLIKSGGTSAQYLMADGSVSTLTNPVTGTGTTNYLAKFTGANSIGNSLIYDDGTTITFQTGASERMRITSAGNVGIGTTSPVAQLQLNNNTFTSANGFASDPGRVGMMVNGSLKSYVYASTYNDPTYPDYGFVFIHGPNTSSYNVWSISPDGPAKGSGLHFIYQANSANIHNQTPAVSFIGSSGNVLIGTTTDAGYRLHVSGGNGYVDGDLTVTGTLTAQELYVEYISSSIIYSTGSNKFGNKTSDTHQFTGSILQSGSLAYFASNVGIGTATPASKANILATKTTALTTSDDFLTLGLTVDDNTAFDNVGVGGGIAFRGKRNSGGAQTIYAAIDSSKETNLGDEFRGALRFYTNQNSTGVPLERMRITSAGNVLIGTTTDSGFKLDVNGTARVGATLGLTAGAASAIIRRTAVNGSNGISIQGNANDTVSDTNAGASIFVGGGVIGDTFEGNIVLTAYGSIVDSNRNSIRFSNRSGVNTIAERMRINHEGNVGIGLTNPVQPLQLGRVSVIAQDINSMYIGANFGSGTGGNYIISQFANQIHFDSATGAINFKVAGTGTAGNAISYTTALAIASTGAATFSSSVTATSLIKSGGTSAQYLMADGSVSTLTNPVTGTGTTNFLPKFTGATAIGNSQVFDDGTNVGIGTTSLNRKLTVAGSGVFTDGTNDITIWNDGTIGTNGNLALKFNTNGTLKATLTASGNLGLGVTPSAWSGRKVIQADVSSFSSVSNNMYLGTNYYDNGVNNIYINNGFASLYSQGSSFHIWYIAPSGTAGNAISFTQAMALNASGNVLINTPTDSGFRLDVNGTGVFRGQLNVFNANTVVRNDTGSTYRGLSIGATIADNAEYAFVKYEPNGGNFRFWGSPALFGGTTSFFNNDIQWLNVSSANALSFTGAATFSAGVTATSFTGSFSGSLAAPGATTQVAFNSGGTLSADSGFVYSGSRVGIGTTSPVSRLHVGIEVIDDNSYSYDPNTLVTVHQTPTSTATLNDPKEVLMLARQGTSGEAYGAAATFDLSRYENSSVSSRTRLDFRLAHTQYLTTSTCVMTLLSSGNVGIGTTAPAYPLQLNSTVGGGGMMSIVNTSTTEASISYRVSNGGATTGWVVGNYANDYFLYSYTFAGRVATFKPSGNVGIGTTSPSSLLELFGASSTLSDGNFTIGTNSITGATRFSFKRAGTTVGQIAYSHDNENLELIANTASSGIVFYSAGTNERMRITSGGNVGIGTTAPGHLLSIFGTPVSDGDLKVVQKISSNAASSTTPRSGLGFGANYTTGGDNAVLSGIAGGKENATSGNFAGVLTFFTRPNGGDHTERMRITSGGNVGIGTSSPSVKLHVTLEGLVSTYNEILRIESTNLNSGSKLTFFGKQGSDANSKLSGAIGFTQTLNEDNNGQPAFIVETGNNGSITEKMRITSAGLVGIGTTSPSQALSVVGDFAIANTTSIQESRIGKYQSGSLGSGTHTIASISVTNVDAVFFDYVIKNSTTDLRAGTVMAVTNGSTVEYTDISTSDIGDTSRITMISDVSGGNIRLRASIDTGAGSWTVRTLLRTI